MPEKVRPAVAISLDKERHLLLDLNAMVAFQEATGKNLFDNKVAEALGKNISPRDLRALLWACLLHEDETLTEKQVGSWIRPDNIEEIGVKIASAWGTATPEAKEDTKKSPLVRHPAG